MVEMSKLQEDALRELTNMCSYHASMALEKLIGQPVQLNISSRDIISLENREDDYSKAPVMMLGIYSSLERGDLDGNIVLAFSKDSALGLYDALMKQELGTTQFVNDYVKNLFVEIGNIVSGQMLGVFNKLVGMKAEHTIPTVVPSFGNMIYDYVFFNISEELKHAILIRVDTKFKLQGTDVDGEIILLLSHKSFDILLDNINKVSHTK